MEMSCRHGWKWVSLEPVYLTGRQIVWPREFSALGAAVQVSPKGSNTEASCHHSRAGISPDMCVPRRRKDCAYFRGRQVQHPRVKATPEVPSSSVPPSQVSTQPVESPFPEICHPFQGLLYPLELDRKPANHSLCQIWPPPLFVNKVLLAHSHAHYFM